MSKKDMIEEIKKFKRKAYKVIPRPSNDSGITFKNILNENDKIYIKFSALEEISTVITPNQIYYPNDNQLLLKITAQLMLKNINSNVLIKDAFTIRDCNIELNDQLTVKDYHHTKDINENKYDLMISQENHDIKFSIIHSFKEEFITLSIEYTNNNIPKDRRLSFGNKKLIILTDFDFEVYIRELHKLTDMIIELERIKILINETATY